MGSTVLFFLAVLLAGSIFVLDLMMPLGVVGGVPYVAVVLISLWLPGRWPPLALAMGCSGLTILGFFYSPPCGELWKAMANRWVAVGVIWVTSLLTVWRKQSEQALRESEERYRVQAEGLARSNLELEQFAYVASHDLQEPLRKIESFTQLLAQRYRDQMDAGADKFIDYIVDGTQRMRALITDLLRYSRVAKGQLSLVPTDLSSVIGRILVDLETAIREENGSVTYDPLPNVVAEPSLMVQLFQNLISNALKFHGKKPPRVHVAAEQRRKQWVFSVKDNGIGIEPEYTEQVFDVFKRLHRRVEYPGTGMGLSICKKIVQQHGGKIWLESEVGKGTTVYFTINKGDGA